MKIRVFCCPSVKRELYYLASFCSHDADIEIVPPELSQPQLQTLIDRCTADRIVLAFGQRRLEGLHSSSVPVIAPKAHDCAHLLLGSAERYRRIFSENDDRPCWLNCADCGFPCQSGPRCAVKTGVFPNDLIIPEGTREYIADLSLLKSLLELDFNENQAIKVPPNCRITADPVEIISFEPL